MLYYKLDILMDFVNAKIGFEVKRELCRFAFNSIYPALISPKAPLPCP